MGQWVTTLHPSSPCLTELGHTRRPVHKSVWIFFHDRRAQNGSSLLWTRLGQSLASRAALHHASSAPLDFHDMLRARHRDDWSSREKRVQQKQTGPKMVDGIRSLLGQRPYSETLRCRAFISGFSSPILAGRTWRSETAGHRLGTLPKHL